MASASAPAPAIWSPTLRRGPTPSSIQNRLTLRALTKCVGSQPKKLENSEMVEITKVQSQILSEERDSYSRVVVVDDWAFVSITAGVEVTPRRVPTTPAEQAHKMIDNVEASLKAIGFELGDV